MARKHTEDDIQRAIATHLNIRGAEGLVWFHVPNGGKRNPREAARLKAMGVKPGVSDLILFHKERLYCLELKAPGGRATEAQMAFMTDMGLAGAFCCIADGMDRAIRVLEDWQLLVGRVT